MISGTPEGRKLRLLVFVCFIDYPEIVLYFDFYYFIFSRTLNLLFVRGIDKDEDVV